MAPVDVVMEKARWILRWAASPAGRAAGFDGGVVRGILANVERHRRHTPKQARAVGNIYERWGVAAWRSGVEAEEGVGVGVGGGGDRDRAGEAPFASGAAARRAVEAAIARAKAASAGVGGERAFSGADERMLLGLLRYHPRPEKVSGATGVRLNAFGNGVLMRFADGRPDETVSVYTCCEALGRGLAGANAAARASDARLHERDVTQALRNEVLEQTRAVREAAGLMGKGLTTHVGHGEGERAFVAIKRRFLARPEVPALEAIEIVRRKLPRLEYTSPFLRDEALAEAWRRFHAAEATLFMQTASDNLRRSERPLSVVYGLPP